YFFTGVFESPQILFHDTSGELSCLLIGSEAFVTLISKIKN
ncbi:hypothetical protein Nmel_008500, partial [Mimus melanotis]